jgi:hypothetical protein
VISVVDGGVTAATSTVSNFTVAATSNSPLNSTIAITADTNSDADANTDADTNTNTHTHTNTKTHTAIAEVEERNDGHDHGNNITSATVASSPRRATPFPSLPTNQHQHQHHQQLPRHNPPFSPTSANQQTSTSINNDTTHHNHHSNNHHSNNHHSNNSRGDFRGGQESWQAMFYNLMVYKVNHDNCTNVKYEKDHTPHHALYSWLQNQRKHYKYYIEGKQPSYLNEERIKVLESIGIEWNVRGHVFWEKMYSQLIEYRNEVGDTLVPRQWVKNKKLGEWVTDQRRQYKYKIANRSTLLTIEREQKLNEIGFTWSIRNRTDWDSRFEDLVLFKSEFGHCVVPQLYSNPKGLGKWVSKQREQYKRLMDGKSSFITQDRIEKLNGIGFSWSAKGRRTTESLVGTEMMKVSNINNNNNSVGSTIHPDTIIPVANQQTIIAANARDSSTITAEHGIAATAITAATTVNFEENPILDEGDEAVESNNHGNHTESSDIFFM